MRSFQFTKQKYHYQQGNLPGLRRNELGKKRGTESKTQQTFLNPSEKGNVSDTVLEL